MEHLYVRANLEAVISSKGPRTLSKTHLSCNLPERLARNLSFTLSFHPETRISVNLFTCLLLVSILIVSILPSAVMSIWDYIYHDLLKMSISYTANCSQFYLS